MKSKWWMNLLLGVVLLIMVMPVALIFVTSFKTEADVIEFNHILPTNPTLENYQQLAQNAEEAPVMRWLLNSVFISTTATLLVITISSLAAFSLARLNPPGSKYIFRVILLTMMVPGQVLLLPVYMLLNQLGWIDTYMALIIPPASGAFGVFLLTGFFRQLPKELEEAAALDGCGRWGLFIHVALPLSRPVLATLGILTFVGVWNDFLGPLVFIDSMDRFTLPVGIALFQSSYTNEYGLTLAASVICTLPVLVIFLMFSKHILRGIAAGALKE